MFILYVIFQSFVCLISVFHSSVLSPQYIKYNRYVLQRKYEGSNSPSSGDWDKEEHMFLVCVYNVSPDQPYTIFKAPISSTSQDIITQVITLQYMKYLCQKCASLYVPLTFIVIFRYGDGQNATPYTHLLLSYYVSYRLLDSLVVECWLRVREVPGSILSQGPRHTKDVIKMVPVVPLFSTQH